MAFKRSGNGLIKIVSATAVSVFSLFSLIMGSYAWFSLNLNAVSNGANLYVGDVGTAVKSISVHEFYGATTDNVTLGFNPTPDHSVTWSDFSGNESVLFDMGTYSLGDPHHPVLYLFETDGNDEVIKLLTDFCYLANEKPSYTVTVSSYSNLSTYSDGTKVLVEADERHGGTSSIYEAVDGNLEMKWIDLQNDTDNPLSSIIQAHYFIFDYNPKTSNTVTGTLKVNGTEQQKTYIPFLSAQCEAEYTDNMSSFVSFETTTPLYSNETTLYEGSTFDNGYIGIVFDYYPEAIQYIYTHFLGHEYLNRGLEFTCDWDMTI